MTSDFIPLSLKWRPVAGADLPGFRAAEANADGEWLTVAASPNVAEADSLMRAIAAGATEGYFSVMSLLSNLFMSAINSLVVSCDASTFPFNSSNF